MSEVCQAPSSEPQADTPAPMLGAPRHVVGRREPCFSPARLFALSRVSRPGVGVDEGCWLVEQPLQTVHARGIHLGGEWYTHPHLLGLTGSSSVGKRPALVIRYDGALLARGVLDEVVVLERLAGGELVERLRCRPAHAVVHEVDLTEVLQARRAYERELLAMRTLHEAEYVDLASGQAALEQLRADQRTRQREQRRPVQPVRPATPEFAPRGPTMGDLLLAGPPAAAGAGESMADDVVRAADAVAASVAGAGDSASEAGRVAAPDAPAAATSRRAREPRARTPQAREPRAQAARTGTGRKGKTKRKADAPRGDAPGGDAPIPSDATQGPTPSPTSGAPTLAELLGGTTGFTPPTSS